MSNGSTPIEAIFIDCDDCLYQNDWATAKKITNSIAAYTEKLGVSKDQAYQFYKTHGTCLKGLLVEGLIDEEGAEKFLHEVHQIDYSDIDEDSKLRKMLEPIASLSWIFTASAREHAERCMGKIGITDLPFRGIIDTRTCKLETKHSKQSFDAAMKTAGISNPAACVFFDDSVKNIVAAKAVGWRTVLVGKVDRDTAAPITCDAADVHVASLHELPEAFPELFEVANMKVTAKKSSSFYIQAAKALLRDSEAKDGSPRKAFAVLHISGLGDAIAATVAAATALEAEGIGKVTKVETTCVQMNNGGPCAGIRVTIQRS